MQVIVGACAGAPSVVVVAGVVVVGGTGGAVVVVTGVVVGGTGGAVGAVISRFAAHLGVEVLESVLFMKVFEMS